MDMELAKQHKHYELCRRAHYNTSFSPEKRAAMYVQDYDNTVQSIKDMCEGVDVDMQRMLDGYEKRFVAHMDAKSRCLSTMITGASNFPVRRAEKANNSEHKRSLEVTEYLEKIRKVVDKIKRPHKHGVSSDAEDALEILEKQVAAAKNSQEIMKKANAICRKKTSTTEEKLEQLIAAGLTQKQASAILVPDYANRIGFASYQLSNNLANIKRLEGRVAELKSKQDKEDKTTQCGGFEVVQNYTDNRLQLLFEDKPSEQVRGMLKKRGFKWSPRNTAWQRMLNNNAIYAFREFHKEYKQLNEVA